MKDNHRREWFLTMGYMYSPNCSCCNWTLHGNRHVNKRIANKMVRAREKRNLEKEVKDERT